MAHQIVITWVASPLGQVATYNVYRSSFNGPPPFLNTGQTASTLIGWTKVASSIAALTFTDTTVGPGQWAYFITATATGGAESTASNIVWCEIMPTLSGTPVTVAITGYQ